MPSAGLRRRLCRARRCAECTRRAEAGVSTSGLPALAAVPSVARFEGGSRWLHAHMRAHDAFFVERCGMFIVGCVASMAWARHLVLGSSARARCAAASAGSRARHLCHAPRLGALEKLSTKTRPCLTLPSTHACPRWHTTIPRALRYSCTARTHDTICMVRLGAAALVRCVCGAVLFSACNVRRVCTCVTGERVEFCPVRACRRAGGRAPPKVAWAVDLHRHVAPAERDRCVQTVARPRTHVLRLRLQIHATQRVDHRELPARRNALLAERILARLGELGRHQWLQLVVPLKEVPLVQLRQARNADLLLRGVAQLRDELAVEELRCGVVSSGKRPRQAAAFDSKVLVIEVAQLLLSRYRDRVKQLLRSVAGNAERPRQAAEARQSAF
eukprot:scaffold44188_cov63-Phaeocystis_antarctica.AAC.4